MPNRNWAKVENSANSELGQSELGNRNWTKAAKLCQTTGMRRCRKNITKRGSKKRKRCSRSGKYASYCHQHRHALTVRWETDVRNLIAEIDHSHRGSIDVRFDRPNGVVQIQITHTSFYLHVELTEHWPFLPPIVKVVPPIASAVFDLDGYLCYT